MKWSMNAKFKWKRKSKSVSTIIECLRKMSAIMSWKDRSEKKHASKISICKKLMPLCLINKSKTDKMKLMQGSEEHKSSWIGWLMVYLKTWTRHRGEKMKWFRNTSEIEKWNCVAKKRRKQNKLPVIKIKWRQLLPNRKKKRESGS